MLQIYTVVTFFNKFSLELKISHWIIHWIILFLLYSVAKEPEAQQIIIECAGYLNQYDKYLYIWGFVKWTEWKQVFDYEWSVNHIE